MLASAFVLGRSYGLLSLEECMDTVMDGFSMMLTAISILIMAWSIGSAAGALGTGAYVSSIAASVLTPTTLLLVVFAFSAFIAFSTGTSWGTMAIVTPIVISLAWSIAGQSPGLLSPAVGAIFSGAIYGDHCSPISDTTILSSTFTGADHIDHVRTQLYYATTVAAVASVLFIVYGMIGVTPLVLLPLGAVALVGLVYVLSEFDSRRKDVSARTQWTAR